MPQPPTMWFRVWALGHVVSVGLETEINHVGSQLINHAYIMEPQSKLQMLRLELASPVGNTACVYLESNISWLHRERTMKDLCLEPSWTLPYAFLPLTSFNLYPFPTINHNHEYNSFQWVRCVETEGALGNPSQTCSWCQKWKQSWGLCPPTSYSDLNSSQWYNVIGKDLGAENPGSVAGSTSCVNLGNLFTLSVPQCPHLWNENNTIYMQEDYCKN